MNDNRRPVSAFAAMALSLACMAPAGAAVALYVSPSGSDSNDGRSAATPLRTLARAQSAVRALNGHVNDDIVVQLASGTYVLSATLALTAADSGMNGHTVFWQGPPAGPLPVISGGVVLTGWSRLADGRWRTSVPTGASQARQLYVNGVRAVRAAHAVNRNAYTVTPTGLTTTDATISNLVDATAASLVAEQNWKSQRCQVQSQSRSAAGVSSIVMQQPCWHDVQLQFPELLFSLFDGAPSWVDQPGEFAIDGGTVYYRPRAGEDLFTAEVVLPMIEFLVTAHGSADAPVRNVTFERLSFQHATWTRPSSPDGYAEGQAGVMLDNTARPDPAIEPTIKKYYVQRQLHSLVMPGALDLSHAIGIKIDSSTFSKLGAAAISFGLGVKNAYVSKSTITDVSGNGIELGSAADPVSHHPSNPADIVQDNTISDNLISHIGAEYHDCVGILATYTTHSVIDHNTIHDVPYSGISVGWGWALVDQQPETGQLSKHSGIFAGGYLPMYYTPSTSSKNQISNNHIYNAVQYLADAGGIYTLGAMEGTEITGNYLHDIALNPAHPGGGVAQGLYLDEGTTHTVWSNNVIERVTIPVTVHDLLKSPEISIVNNFFDTDPSIAPSNGLTVSGNVVVQNGKWPPAAVSVMQGAGAR
ncbi:MAG: right-handed parallel beta-helix repeat-containing protein [Pseudomonadota bacterium]|nr:right-handed parallel beta-helix repeat-containing protein [Pseudomonadota bacterium]